MNAKQLRNLLLDYPDDTEILIASDPEGNGYYRLVEIGISYIYAEEDSYQIEDVYDEADEPEFMEPRLVLWP